MPGRFDSSLLRQISSHHLISVLGLASARSDGHASLVDNSPMFLGILLKAGAITLALGAGWAMGRTIPVWQIDRKNEDTSNFSRDSDAGCGTLVILFMQGAYWAAGLGIASLVLGAYAWGDGIYPGYSEAFFSPPLILAIAAICGYVPSRLTDKGPVGPLD